MTKQEEKEWFTKMIQELPKESYLRPFFEAIREDVFWAMDNDLPVENFWRDNA